MSLDQATVDLLAIAARHRTQKLSHPHYMPLYAKYFGPGREQVCAVLELGVGDGASLRIWEEWFPNAVITGVDNHSMIAHEVTVGSDTFPSHMRTLPDNFGRTSTWIYESEQDDPVGLKPALTRAPFDLIIDDASHDPKKQWDSLQILFPHVRPGGCYVIEDLEYSYAEERVSVDQCSYCGLGGVGIIDCVAGLIEDINETYIDKEMGKSHRAKPRMPGLASVHFYPNIIFLWKEVS